MNSPFAELMLEALAPTMTSSVGDIGKTPVPETVSELPIYSVESLIGTAKADWDDSETSWNFNSNPLVVTFQCTQLDG